MTIYSYAIGSSNPPTNLESLTVPVNPPTGRFFEATQWLDMADGNQKGQGFPWARWDFVALSQAMITQLRTFCPGQSATVYIGTRINTGGYALYTGIMLWPGREQFERRIGANLAAPTGFYNNLQFTFRRLTYVGTWPP